jgi:hypothetical protein
MPYRSIEQNDIPNGGRSGIFEPEHGEIGLTLARTQNDDLSIKMSPVEQHHLRTPACTRALTFERRLVRGNGRQRGN